MRAKFCGTDFDAPLFKIVEPFSGEEIQGVFEADIETCTILQFDLDEKGMARCTDWEPAPGGPSGARRRHLKMVMRTHDFDVLDRETNEVVATARRTIRTLIVGSESEAE